MRGIRRAVCLGALLALSSPGARANGDPGAVASPPHARRPRNLLRTQPAPEIPIPEVAIEAPLPAGLSDPEPETAFALPASGEGRTGDVGDSRLAAVENSLRHYPDAWGRAPSPAFAGADAPAGSRHELALRLAEEPVDYFGSARLVDPNEFVGWALRPGFTVGVQFDMLGPAEFPETERLLLETRRDPANLGFLSTSLGVTINF